MMDDIHLAIVFLNFVTVLLLFYFNWRKSHRGLVLSINNMEVYVEDLPFQYKTTISNAGALEIRLEAS